MKKIVFFIVIIFILSCSNKEYVKPEVKEYTIQIYFTSGIIDTLIYYSSSDCRFRLDQAKPMPKKGDPICLIKGSDVIAYNVDYFKILK